MIPHSSACFRRTRFLCWILLAVVSPSIAYSQAERPGVGKDPVVEALHELEILQLAPVDGAAAVAIAGEPPRVVRLGDWLLEQGALSVRLREVLADRLVVEIRSAEPGVPRRRAWVEKARSLVRILDPVPPALPMPSVPRILDEETPAALEAPGVRRGTAGQLRDDSTADEPVAEGSVTSGSVADDSVADRPGDGGAHRAGADEGEGEKNSAGDAR